MDINKGNFGGVIKILKSLNNTDLRIVEYFKDKGNAARGNFITCYNFNSAEVLLGSEDLEVWKEGINGVLWRGVDSFEHMYENLIIWVNNNNRIPSGKANDEIEKKLGSWCCERKKSYKRNKLHQYKIDKLNSIKQWYWNLADDIFEKKYNNLISWIKDNGRIPLETERDSIEHELGKWCRRQRTFYKKNSLAQAKIDKFNDIEQWYWDKDTFDEKYNDLIRWITKHNKLPSYGSKDPIEKKIGSWCCHQRDKYKKNKLTKEEIDKLNSVQQWYWDHIRFFEEKYSELIIWININNRIPSNSSKDTIEKQLGWWCCTQRQDYKNNKITQYKIDRLETIKHWYWVKTDLFEQIFNDLIIWIENNNRIPSQTNESEIEDKLGIWCCKQRQDYKNKILAQNKIDKLNSIKYWYWGKDVFEEKYNELLIWIMNNNRIPTTNSKNSIEKKLAAWCSTQRGHYKNNTLTKDKIDKLNAIKQWYWGKFDIAFEENYNNLVTWIKNNNRIPTQHSKDVITRKIGMWCCTQRQNYKNKIITQDRINRLEQLEHWYWTK